MDSLALSKSLITAPSYLRSEMSLTLDGRKSPAEYVGVVMRDTAVIMAMI